MTHLYHHLSRQAGGSGRLGVRAHAAINAAIGIYLSRRCNSGRLDLDRVAKERTVHLLVFWVEEPCRENDRPPDNGLLLLAIARVNWYSVSTWEDGRHPPVWIGRYDASQ